MRVPGSRLVVEHRQHAVGAEARIVHPMWPARNWVADDRHLEGTRIVSRCCSAELPLDRAGDPVNSKDRIEMSRRDHEVTVWLKVDRVDVQQVDGPEGVGGRGVSGNRCTNVVSLWLK